MHPFLQFTFCKTIDGSNNGARILDYLEADTDIDYVDQSNTIIHACMHSWCDITYQSHGDGEIRTSMHFGRLELCHGLWPLVLH